MNVRKNEMREKRLYKFYEYRRKMLMKKKKNNNNITKMTYYTKKKKRRTLFNWNIDNSIK